MRKATVVLLTSKSARTDKAGQTPMIFRAVAACPSCFRKKEAAADIEKRDDEVAWTVSAMFGTA